MRKAFKLLSIILLLCNLALPIKAYASELITDGIEVKLSVDEITKNEKYSAVYTVKNTNKYDVKNMLFKASLPEGYRASGDDLVQVSLHSGEESSFSFTFVKSAEPKEASEAASGKKSLPIWAWILIGVGALAVIAVIVLLILRGKGIRLFSFFLALVLAGSLIAPHINAYASEISRKTGVLSCEFSSGKEKMQLELEYRYDYNPDAELLRIDTSEFGYDDNENTYSIQTKLNGIGGYLKNPENFTSLSLEVYNDKGTLVGQYSIAPAEDWMFEAVGLFPGKNKIVVKAEGENPLSNELFLRDRFGFNYEYVANSEKDSDKDGLFDNFELYLGTDIKNKDTDGDGLTDYQEACELGTDPLNVDTDGNGVSDFDEDADEDKISNGREYKLGSSPIFPDTDFDGLNDYDEVETYKTKPAAEDTDGDGANDGWEVLHGYDPLIFNKSFEVSAEPAETTKAIPVTAGVSVVTDGGESDVDSLSVERVSTFDNPFISPTVVGYLGDAYEFSFDGSFKEAELVFEYDKALGAGADDFEPRIYYFNEDTKEFEELENQTVEGDAVKAVTTHFSTYTVMNKAEVDRAYGESEQYRDAEMEKTINPISVTFVFDTSASMALSDTEGIAKDTAEYIVGKMRPGLDTFNVLTYTKTVNCLKPVSTDAEKAIDLVKSIGYDNGMNSASGSNGLVALEKALSLAKDNSESDKYIFLFTDGRDTESKSYKAVEESAVSKKIKIYTIGIGEVDEKLLTEIASATGGKFINKNIKANIDEILSNLVLSSVDSNNDGINDYYTKLIFEGKLLTSNHSSELSGIDLNYDKNGNLSDDYDGDGIKNGKEITIGNDSKGRLCVKMSSHPCIKDSDGDGFDDSTERNNGSDCMKYTVEKKYIDVLVDRNSGWYYESSFYDNYKESVLYQGFSFLMSGIFEVWNKDELYRDLIIDYYSNCATKETLKCQELCENKKVWTDFGTKALASIQGIKEKTKDNYDDVKAVYELLDYVYSASKIDVTEIKALQKILGKISHGSDTIKEVALTIYDKWGLDNTADVLKKFGSTKVGKVAGKVSAFSIDNIDNILDIADTFNSFARINASNSVFKENMDELDYMILHSDDNHARDAARMIKDRLIDGYEQEILAVFEDAVEFGAKIAIDALGESCPYVAAVLLVRDGIDALFGIGEDIEQQYKMLCYHEMGLADSHYLKRILKGNGDYYEIDEKDLSNFYRYAINLSQTRILGERMFYEWQEVGGLLGALGVGENLLNLAAIREGVNTHISAIRGIADVIHVTLSSAMEYEL